MNGDTHLNFGFLSIELIYLLGDGGEEYVCGMFCVFVFVVFV